MHYPGEWRLDAGLLHGRGSNRVVPVRVKVRVRVRVRVEVRVRVRVRARLVNVRVRVKIRARVMRGWYLLGLVKVRV